jgi:uncharacterized protein (TIGR02391 family)
MASNAKIVETAKIIAGLTRKLGLADKSKATSGPTPIDILDLYYNLVTDEELKKHTEKRFINGHYQDAVLEAFKYLNNYVKSRVRDTSSDGSSLMREAFSAKNPILKINEFASQSEKDEQHGYMDIFSGVMVGIRNPRAHENDFDNDPFIAVQLLSLADHLLQRAKKAKRRKRNKEAS